MQLLLGHIEVALVRVSLLSGILGGWSRLPSGHQSLAATGGHRGNGGVRVVRIPTHLLPELVLQQPHECNGFCTFLPASIHDHRMDGLVNIICLE